MRLRALSMCCLLAACATTPASSAPSDASLAHVSGVTTSGTSWSVTIESEETGCDQYADWWEVTSADGETLHYRRILAHSHVDEQPFTRSGGPVNVGEDDEVVVRAHMHPNGYGGRAWRGTAAGGFTEVELEDGFGAQLETAEPQPSGCAF